MENPPTNVGQEPLPDNVRKRELTLIQKNLIIKDLLGRLKNDGQGIELRYGAFSAAAKKLNADAQPSGKFGFLPKKTQKNLKFSRSRENQEKKEKWDLKRNGIEMRLRKD